MSRGKNPPTPWLGYTLMLATLGALIITAAAVFGGVKPVDELGPLNTGPWQIQEMPDGTTVWCAEWERHGNRGFECVPSTKETPE